jgi:hypothetical protein
MLLTMHKLKTVAIIALLGLLGAGIAVTAAVWLNTRIVTYIGWYIGPNPPFSNPIHYGALGLLAGIGVGIGLLMPSRSRLHSRSA